MGVYTELERRGLIAQVTHPEKVKDMLENEKISFYIGFDPTADSLHVGHFLQMVIMAHMQKAGHRPIALMGGGTAMVGDPSGRTDMRQMLTKETINYNVNQFKKQFQGMIDFSEGKALMVNNADWLLDLNYIEFLRDIGVHFSVNNMLRAECFKKRFKHGLILASLMAQVWMRSKVICANSTATCCAYLAQKKPLPKVRCMIWYMRKAKDSINMSTMPIFANTKSRYCSSFSTLMIASAISLCAYHKKPLHFFNSQNMLWYRLPICSQVRNIASHFLLTHQYVSLCQRGREWC